MKLPWVQCRGWMKKGRACSCGASRFFRAVLMGGRAPEVVYFARCARHLEAVQGSECEPITKAEYFVGQVMES